MSIEARSGALHLTVVRQAAGDIDIDDAPADVRTERLGGGALLMVIGGRPRVVTVERDGKTARVSVGGHTVDVALRTETDRLLERFGMDAADASAEREVRAPMPGLVLRVLARVGDTVEAGQGLVVLEAMKMENELKAPAAGVVESLHVAPGAAVAKGELLVSIAL